MDDSIVVSKYFDNWELLLNAQCNSQHLNLRLKGLTGVLNMIIQSIYGTLYNVRYLKFVNKVKKLLVLLLVLCVSNFKFNLSFDVKEFPVTVKPL